MPGLKTFARRSPVLAYLLLCFGISWPVWFAIPLVAGTDWALVKILTGLGFGPALAAILLDRARGTGARVDRRWWTYFTVAFLAVAAINASILLTGDAMETSQILAAKPIGLSAVGVLSSLLTAAMAGFILASVACSRNQRLSSITSWRVPIRWWLAALLLPAGLFLVGLGITTLTGGEPLDTIGGGLPLGIWALFLLRSTLGTLLVVAVGEEPGWRGWMLPELQKRFSPLLSSILLGIVWGFWHLPLFFAGLYDGEPVLVVAKIIACVNLAILFTWLYNRTGGNLLLAAVLHTALNNTPRVIPATPWMAGSGLALVIALIFLERMWRRRSA